MLGNTCKATVQHHKFWCSLFVVFCCCFCSVVYLLLLVLFVVVIVDQFVGVCFQVCCCCCCHCFAFFWFVCLSSFLKGSVMMIQWADTSFFVDLEQKMTKNSPLKPHKA